MRPLPRCVMPLLQSRTMHHPAGLTTEKHSLSTFLQNNAVLVPDQRFLSCFQANARAFRTGNMECAPFMQVLWPCPGGTSEYYYPTFGCVDTCPRVFVERLTNLYKRVRSRRQVFVLHHYFRTTPQMDIKKVSVEDSGPFIQALTCFGEGSELGVRLDRLNDRSLADPEKSFGPFRTFSLIPLPHEGQTAPDSGQVRFALQSQINKAYLGFNLNDRRLLMRLVQHPPPDSFRFAYSSNIPRHYDDDGAPVHITAADGKPVNDPNNADREFSLFVRSFQEPNISRTIDESWKQQLALISVLGEKEPSDEPAAHIEMSGWGNGGSNFDNNAELAMVREMERTGDLRTAINALAEEKYDGYIPPF